MQNQTFHDFSKLVIQIYIEMSTNYMNGEDFDILNYCILNRKFYIHKQKLFHENALDFYEYLWDLKYKLQIERMICKRTNNDE